MTKVSRIPLSAKEMEIIQREFWKAIASLRTAKEARSFFFDILTHTERKMLAKRLQIARMLIDGESYDTIRRSLKVTDVTISKINNWLEAFGDGFRLALSRTKKFK